MDRTVYFRINNDVRLFISIWRIILRWIFRKWDVGGIDWIELNQDRYRWWELVNEVMNFRVP